MTDDDKSKGLDPRTQITLAVVGLIGTVAVALFTNWDKLFASNSPSTSPPTSTQSTTQPPPSNNPSNIVMSLPIGDWDINGNGYKRILRISAIDTDGNIQGLVDGNPIIGFWDEDAQKITFMRVIDRNDPSTIQVHTGYMFSNREGTSTVYTLAGSFEGFAGTGATAQRITYGWYAQINR